MSFNFVTDIITILNIANNAPLNLRNMAAVDKTIRSSYYWSKQLLWTVPTYEALSSLLVYLLYEYNIYIKVWGFIEIKAIFMYLNYTNIMKCICFLIRKTTHRVGKINTLVCSNKVSYYYNNYYQGTRGNDYIL